MKIYSIDSLPDSIVLGKQTEQGVHEVRIDCAPWLARWPELAISVWVTPPGGSAAYPTVTHMEGDLLVWTVSLDDTVTPGRGFMEVMGVAEGKKKLSSTAGTLIRGTTTDTTSEPPEAAQAWVDNVATNAGRAETAAADAEASASAAKTSQQEALDAQIASETAQATAVDAASRAESHASSAQLMYREAHRIYWDNVDPARNEAVAAAQATAEDATAANADAVKAETARDAAMQAAARAEQAAGRAELETSKVPETVNNALTQAKESGEFKGDTGASGQRGAGFLCIKTKPEQVRLADGSGYQYWLKRDVIKSEAGVDEVYVGDIVICGTDVYRIKENDPMLSVFVVLYDPFTMEGSRGAGVYAVTIAMEKSNGADGTTYLFKHDDAKAETGVDEFQAGDIILKDTCLYKVCDPSYPYLRCSFLTDTKGGTGATGPEGPAGAEGFSPTVTLTRESDGVTIKATNKSGTSTAKVYDGKDGTGGGTGGGLPTGEAPYQQLVTDAEGNAVWEDKPFGEQIGAILPETEINGESENMVTLSMPIVVGESYTVVINGTAYECVAAPFSMDGVSAEALGDVNFLLTGEPTPDAPAFVLLQIPGMTAAMMLDGSTSMVSISGKSFKKLDPKYIDLAWMAGEKAVGETIVPLAVHHSGSNYENLDKSLSQVLTGGKKLVVFHDDQLYETTLVNAGEFIIGGNASLINDTLANTGEPFYLMVSSEFIHLVFVTYDSCLYAIYEPGDVQKIPVRLPEQYAPNNSILYVETTQSISGDNIYSINKTYEEILIAYARGSQVIFRYAGKLHYLSSNITKNGNAVFMSFNGDTMTVSPESVATYKSNTAHSAREVEW